MKVFLSQILLIFSLVGCGVFRSYHVTSLTLIDENREKLAKIYPGMTKTDVVKIMGGDLRCKKCFIENRIVKNPYRTEMRTINIDGAKPWEILYYIVYFKEGDECAFASCDAHIFEPLIFDENGVLVGVGNEYLEKMGGCLRERL